MQTYPAAASRVAATLETASSMSASSNTMQASDPPSSRTHFFKFSPEREATVLPALSDPVTVVALILGSRIA